jgi:hypothetical protein
MKTQILSAVLTAGFVVGCATSVPAPGRADLLDFLVDGRTSKRQVFAALGQPSGRFERGDLLTYRVGYEAANHGYHVVSREVSASGWPTWRQAKYSLVLEFEGGVLQKHNLVEVN